MEIQNQMEFITKARNKCGKFYLWYICTVVLDQYEELLPMLPTFFLHLSLLLLLIDWPTDDYLASLVSLWVTDCVEEVIRNHIHLFPIARFRLSDLSLLSRF